MNTFPLTRPPHYQKKANTWAGVTVTVVVVLMAALGSVGGTGYAMFYAFMAALWLLPWIVAIMRGSMLDLPVLLITVLLGWTGIGWITAMVLAVWPHRQVQVPPYDYSPVVG